MIKVLDILMTISNKKGNIYSGKNLIFTGVKQ